MKRGQNGLGRRNQGADLEEFGHNPTIRLTIRLTIGDSE